MKKVRNRTLMVSTEAAMEKLMKGDKAVAQMDDE
jgi:hypothetical protein